MQNLLIASCLALASASAYNYGGPGLATWPSVGNGYGASSTVWGAHGYRIGKRSADASYGHGYGHGLVVPTVAVAHVAVPTTVENHNNVFGHQGATQYSVSQGHPGAAGSFQQVSRVHSGILGGYGGYGKRSADAYYGAGYGHGLVVPAVAVAHVAVPTTLENRNNVHGHELASGYAISQPHPGHAGSYQARSQLHSGYGKRSAEPYYATGLAVHPGHATSFTARSPQGLNYGHSYGYGFNSYGKRSAEPYYGYPAASSYAVSQAHPGYSGSYQQVSRLHSGIHAYAGYGLY